MLYVVLLIHRTLFSDSCTHATDHTPAGCTPPQIVEASFNALTLFSPSAVTGHFVAPTYVEKPRRLALSGWYAPASDEDEEDEEDKDKDKDEDDDDKRSDAKRKDARAESAEGAGSGDDQDQDGGQNGGEGGKRGEKKSEEEGVDGGRGRGGGAGRREVDAWMGYAKVHASRLDATDTWERRHVYRTRGEGEEGGEEEGEEVGEVEEGGSHREGEERGEEDAYQSESGEQEEERGAGGVPERGAEL